MTDTFEHLLEQLMKANQWLSPLPAPNNKHSFSIGAFVGSKPVFALISNFEHLSSKPALTAFQQLTLSKMRPTRAKTFVSGQRQAVLRDERNWLASLASKDLAPERMYQALVEVNRAVQQTAPQR